MLNIKLSLHSSVSATRTLVEEIVRNEN